MTDQPERFEGRVAVASCPHKDCGWPGFMGSRVEAERVLALHLRDAHGEETDE